MENFRLKVFRTVATRLNFRQAAEELYLTQPAVTLQVKALEEELGLLLFDRSGHRIALTEAGRRLLKHAEKLAALASDAERDLARLKGENRGKLHIGASTTIAQYYLPKLAGEFGRMHPQVAMSVVSGNTADIVKEVLAGNILLGLVEGPAMHRDIRTEKFLTDEIVIIVPQRHEWAGHRVSREQLEKESLIFREQGSGTRHILETALRKAKVQMKSLRIVMELDSTEAIKAATEEGLGVGFVSTRAIQKEVRLGTLREAWMQGLRITRDFSIVTRRGPHVTGLPDTFLEYLRAVRARSIGRTRRPR